MAFPEKNWLGITKGWKNLGRKGSYYDMKINETLYTIHELCGHRLYVGREGEELFNFCPVCLIKIDVK